MSDSKEPTSTSTSLPHIAFFTKEFCKLCEPTKKHISALSSDQKVSWEAKDVTEEENIDMVEEHEVAKLPHVLVYAGAECVESMVRPTNEELDRAVERASYRLRGVPLDEDF